MGGNRFKSIETVRIDVNTHNMIASKTIKLLADFGINAEALPYIRNKKSFGDIDLIAKKSQTHQAIKDITDPKLAKNLLHESDENIAKAINAEMHSRQCASDPVLGMLIKSNIGSVNIDLITIEDEVYDFAKAHLSWGDAGSLISVISKEMGIKAGMGGARLSVPSKNGNIYVPISITYPNFLKLIGLDSDKHEEGFNTQEEIHKWVSEGIMFDPRIWDMDRLTSRARNRIRKRPNYMAWIAWLENNNPERNYNWGEQRAQRAGEWLPALLAMFPSAKKSLELKEEEQRQQKILSDFYNGNIVSQISGITGEALGHLMNAIRKDIGDKKLMDLAHQKDEETLRDKILSIAATDYIPENVIIKN